jgi:hypothetical protein
LAKVIQLKWFIRMAFAVSLWFFCTLAKGQKAQSGSVSFVSKWNLRLSASNSVIEKSFQSGENLFRFARKQLDDKANSGFPFAQLHFDTLLYPEKKSALLVANLDDGPLVLQGNLIIQGDTGISSLLVAKALHIKKDLPFSYRRYQLIPGLVRQLGFAGMLKEPELRFFGNQAIVHIFLEKRRANYFTGILGILPQSDNQGGTIITGNVDAGFVNLFNRGIAFNLKWNRFAPQSQMAELNLAVPYLNYNGLGMEGSFDLFRQDSVINRRKAEARISSAPGAGWKFLFGYKSVFSSGLEDLRNTSKVELKTQSVSFTVQKLYPIANGIDLLKRQFSFSVFPVLKFLKRSGEQEKAFPQLEASISWKYPVRFSYRRVALQTSGLIQTLFSEQLTLQDQYRIGGNNSVRGFNENFFYTSRHALLSVQPQFLVDQNLLLGVFSDFFVYQPRLGNDIISNAEWALGFGLASEIDIGSNQVRISFAAGMTKDIPLDFQTTKIHFGYYARF